MSIKQRLINTLKTLEKELDIKIESMRRADNRIKGLTLELREEQDFLANHANQVKELKKDHENLVNLIKAMSD